jgi:hypothetical protein
MRRSLLSPNPIELHPIELNPIEPATIEPATIERAALEPAARETALAAAEGPPRGCKSPKCGPFQRARL